MRNRSVIWVSVLAVCAMAFGSWQLLHGKAPAPACANAQNTTKHTIVIAGNKPDHAAVQARLCDTVTITNQDATTRRIAFGYHDHHMQYNGVTEKVLEQGQSLRITLTQSGDFHWHDHYHDTVQGTFDVTN